MIKEETLTQSVVIKTRYCDDCGAEMNKSMGCSMACCEICGKDLCEKCVGHEEYDLGGDYRTTYCRKCWNIGSHYRDKIKVLELEIDALNTQWHQDCVLAKNFTFIYPNPKIS